MRKQIYLPHFHAGIIPLPISRPMALKIVQFNEPILRKKGSKITSFNAALSELAEAMIETMHDAEGIGLAAQQIGQAIQLCVVDLRPVDNKFDWEYDGAKPPLELFMPLVYFLSRKRSMKKDVSPSLKSGVTWCDLTRSRPSSRTWPATRTCWSARAFYPAASSTRSIILMGFCTSTTWIRKPCW